MIRFFVDGRCVPKGNHTAFARVTGKCPACAPGRPCGKRNCVGGLRINASVADDNGAELRSWEALVRVTATSVRNKVGARMHPKGVAVLARFTFLMQRPKAHFNTRGELGKDGSAMPYPVSRPDFDKLCRASADGLTGVLYEDDSQVVHAPVTKLWAGNQPGVLISVAPMEIVPIDVVADLDALGIKTGHAQGTLV